MVTFAGIILLVNAVYNAAVWPRFWQRIAADPRARTTNGAATKFYTVHAILVAVALVIALVSAVAGIALLFGALR